MFHLDDRCWEVCFAPFPDIRHGQLCGKRTVDDKLLALKRWRLDLDREQPFHLALGGMRVQKIDFG
ncbi:hypothetical protein MES4922_520001 [Mesorhizobium ventifaucium]|uniref:Uncharacterized protein n=1 Tax=Mesorhizobium ventifaucium TaxID=666020 RepID=A0ABM9EBD7_9HYPH|nr:hypothetical protein MES4922_520001 [Mesorhizobium ventifaucium]